MKDEMIGLEMELRGEEREEREGHLGPVMKLNEKQRICLGKEQEQVY